MIAVSNTTPILSLHKISHLSLLRSLFGEVIVPKAVYNEIAVFGKGKMGDDVFNSIDYISVKELENEMAVSLLRTQLDCGEAEAIVLASELWADVLLLDEKKARRVAKANALPVIGTLGILLAAKNMGIIPDIRTQLDALIANGIWVDELLYHAVLQEAGE